MKSFKDYMEEEAPLNTSGGPGVNMNPTGRTRKLDKRSRYDTYKMYKRSLGLKNVPESIKRGNSDS